jgi:membrane-bound lytic murein transglycosylase F
MRQPFLYCRRGFQLGVLLCIALLGGCGSGEPNALHRVTAAGELRVGALNLPGTFTQDDAGRTGGENALTSNFARTLGVKTTFKLYASRAALLAGIAKNEVDLGAASLVIRPDDLDTVRFGSIYRREPVVVVYRRGQARPRKVADLLGRTVVRATDVQVAGLTEKAMAMGASSALAAVATRERDVAIVKRRDFYALRLVMPSLREAFPVLTTLPVAWAFPRNGGDSLYSRAERWLLEARANQTLARLQSAADDHHPDFDHVAMLVWQRHLRTRLPKFELLFREAGARTGLDWRLLAAMSYQESHWKPDAVSPTGVRGLMMLTRVTAAAMGIKRRTDPAQSIDGGSRYLRRLLNRVSTDVPPSQRILYALAAYNVGPGHVRDAMGLTRSFGHNPTWWADVRQHLPLLEDARYHTRTRYGYARGREPVRYVSNIRRYYDALRWDHWRGNAERPEPIQ